MINAAGKHYNPTLFLFIAACPALAALDHSILCSLLPCCVRSVVEYCCYGFCRCLLPPCCAIAYQASYTLRTLALTLRGASTPASPSYLYIISRTAFPFVIVNLRFVPAARAPCPPTDNMRYAIPPFLFAMWRGGS